MKAVLISIQPKWVEKIASGEKTIEVRKSVPKLERPFKCYIYATKPKKWFRFSSWGYASNESLWLSNGKVKMCDGFEFWAGDKEYEPLCSKVIGEFVCDNILHSNENAFIGNKPLTQYVLKSSCLTMEEINQYRQGKNIYAWHITDLKIYDKPKELSEFYIKCEKGNCRMCDWEREYDVCACKYKKPITRPPQSWCYAEVQE